jgi:transcriptional regulator with XRE-family HTH domain
MRMLDVSNRDVEKKLGLSYGYLSRLFAGSIELKIEHILQIVQVLGLTPAEFFQLAYPRRNTPPSDSALRLRALLDGLAPPPDDRQPVPPPPPLTPEEIEAVIAKVLRKLLKDSES